MKVFGTAPNVLSTRPEREREREGTKGTDWDHKLKFPNLQGVQRVRRSWKVGREQVRKGCEEGAPGD